jgi:hypothetical protein
LFFAALSTIAAAKTDVFMEGDVLKLQTYDQKYLELGA